MNYVDIYNALTGDKSVEDKEDAHLVGIIMDLIYEHGFLPFSARVGDKERLVILEADLNSSWDDFVFKIGRLDYHALFDKKTTQKILLSYYVSLSNRLGCLATSKDIQADSGISHYDFMTRIGFKKMGSLKDYVVDSNLITFMIPPAKKKAAVLKELDSAKLLEFLQDAYNKTNKTNDPFQLINKMMILNYPSFSLYQSRFGIKNYHEMLVLAQQIDNDEFATSKSYDSSNSC